MRLYVINFFRHLFDSPQHGTFAVRRPELRLFELRPEMTWPDGSWLVSKLLGDKGTQIAATVFLILVSLGFAAVGLGLLSQADWWRSVTVISTVFSAVLFLVFWNGKFQALQDQGGVGLLINLAILIVILVFNWPA
jgi:hypothetical protein